MLCRKRNEEVRVAVVTSYKGAMRLCAGTSVHSFRKITVTSEGRSIATSPRSHSALSPPRRATPPQYDLCSDASDSANIAPRCSPNPVSSRAAHQLPLFAATSQQPAHSSARHTTTQRDHEATSHSTLLPGSLPSDTGHLWVGHGRAEAGRMETLTRGTATGFGLPFGIAGKYRNILR